VLASTRQPKTAQGLVLSALKNSLTRLRKDLPESRGWFRAAWPFGLIGGPDAPAPDHNS
jgi:hypothetical protein